MVIVRLVGMRSWDYRNIMTEPIPSGLPQALRIWRSRQTADGFLVAGILSVAAIAVVYFLIQPGHGAATVMLVSLAALVLACVRLIRSAAQVVRIRSSLRMQLALADSEQRASGSSTPALN